jgi:hypothetical protein
MPEDICCALEIVLKDDPYSPSDSRIGNLANKAMVINYGYLVSQF